MGPRKADKDMLADRLLKKFGRGEPIFTSEIIDAWRELSRSGVFRMIRKLLNEETILRDEIGIYYIPEEGVTRKWSVLGRSQIIEKKYIMYDGDIYGYYSGITLLNGLHLTTQMAYHVEIVTSKISSRKIKLRNHPMTLRRSKAPIDKNNVHALMLLEAAGDMDGPFLDEDMEEGPGYRDEVRWIKEFIELKMIKKEDVLRYAEYFPKRALKNLLETGLDVLFG